MASRNACCVSSSVAVSRTRTSSSATPARASRLPSTPPRMKNGSVPKTSNASVAIALPTFDDAGSTAKLIPSRSTARPPTTKTLRSARRAAGVERRHFRTSASTTKAKNTKATVSQTPTRASASDGRWVTRKTFVGHVASFGQFGLGEKNSNVPFATMART